MITKFTLFEGRGISNIIKQYSNYIYEQFINGETGFEIDLDDYQELPLRRLKISFRKENHLNGFYIPGELIENKSNYYLCDVEIYFIINNKETEKHKIVGLITHELTHIKEYFEIKKRMKELNIEITPIYIKIRNAYTNLNIDKINPYYSFIYLLYLSLSTEVNARVAQVYDYLYSLKIKDENELLNKLMKHKNWSFLEDLQNFNHEIFVNDMINKIELNGLINITNELINKLKIEFDKDWPDAGNGKYIIKQKVRTKPFFKFINKDVKNKEDLLYVYKQFERYFKIKAEDNLKHFKYLIKEIIEDLNEKNTYHRYCRNERNDIKKLK